ncbi:quinolinate synthase, partial [Candidatus Bathyarchaeota archaeon]
LRKENPNKTFISAYEDAVCPNMKLNTLERLYLALKNEQHVVSVPKAIAEKARNALENMFKMVNK